MRRSQVCWILACQAARRMSAPARVLWAQGAAPQTWPRLSAPAISRVGKCGAHPALGRSAEGKKVGQPRSGCAKAKETIRL